MKPIKPIEPIKCKPCQANDPQVFYVVLVEWSPPNLVWYFSHGLSELSSDNENLCMDNLSMHKFSYFVSNSEGKTCSRHTLVQCQNSNLFWLKITIYIKAQFTTVSSWKMTFVASQGLEVVC